MSGTLAPSSPALPLCTPAAARHGAGLPRVREADEPVVRERIGVAGGHGFYPVPHRYALYLTPRRADTLRVAVTVRLLGLADTLALVPLEGPGTPAHESLRRAYEATRRHYAGPLAVPALCDRWTGRVVSNHTPDILRDLHGRFGPAESAECGACALRPAALGAETDRLEAAWDFPGAVPGTAPLDALAARLRHAPYVLGERLTAADVDAWSALVALGALPETGGAPHPFLATHPHRDVLTAWTRGLAGRPAFEGALAEGFGVE
ncbi:cell envelope biogenesis protein OmpA [Streptomyces sp. SPB074]|uniref:cell envelope biogenesis protein OmpA n=1 Tax=Streptomyces sp. (strain SPB074) TaxID=465543 RepID=UPI001F177DC6|nr:cell envelope biogenesis protein OmpA [Streptomyces sp. SPB074]